ncbi:SMI1/KNR4 family protein [Flavobacterium sp. MEB061]|uniref:SMI1/KNR4 family protein n=1 Tax=Flavobacterium sp. MEB061 TaxID=1587524 RepID=UPI0006970A5F|nr:SMI1/KNR4 family protein [Flavobacterium sp. MEB061]
MTIEKEKILQLKKIDGNGFFKIKPFKLFGSKIHKYKLNNCLGEAEIEEFEKFHNIKLPTDYRNFIKHIGNGGVGPALGLYKLKDWNLELEIENDNFLKTKFPYTEKWNSDFNGNTEDEKFMDSEEFECWEQDYYNEKHVFGSIRVCHYGCAIYFFLVVSGVEKGNVWVDDRANDQGIYPLSTENNNRYNFTEWYNEWLDQSLIKLKVNKH